MPDDEQRTSTDRVSDRPWVEPFFAFARIGLTSFGGGSATVSAMRELCLRKGWMSEGEFVQSLVLSRLTPGIGILSQTMLIGRRVCGVRGMAAALAGLLLPSLAITVLLAYGYQRVSIYAAAAGPLHAVAGIAAGFSVALAAQLFRDVMKPVPLVRALPFLLLFLLLGARLHSPLAVMALAILLALACPSLFDLAAPAQARPVDDDAAPDAA